MVAIAPFIAAVLAPFIQRVIGSATGWLLALVPSAIFAYLTSFISSIAAGQPIHARIAWIPAYGIDLSFLVDGLSLTFALVISGIGALIVLYSAGYLRGHPHQGRFFAFMLMFMGAMLGLVLADDLLALYGFWELTAVTSFLLIGFDHGRQSARRAAIQALVVTTGGGLALLLGALLLQHVAGVWDLSAMARQGAAIAAHPLYNWIFALFALGAFTKSAQFPFHFWLPNAMEAPTPVSAYLHSATMVQGGVYLLARVAPILGGTPLWATTLVLVGAVTLIWGSLAALKQTDLKQLLAQSTIASLGLLVLLLGLGGETAIMAAVGYFLAHAFYKAAFFLIAGLIDHETGSRDITALGGLKEKMALSFIAAILGAFSMLGLPPAIGYLAKEEMYRALGPLQWAEIVVPLVLVAGNAALGAVALALLIKPFMGAVVATPKAPHEGPLSMLVGPLVLGVLGIGSAVVIAWSAANVIVPAASAIAGHSVDNHLGFTLDFADPAIWLSLATWALSALLFLRLDLVRTVLRRAELVLSWTFDQGFDQAMFSLVRLAALVTRVWQHGRLTFYLATVFLLFALALLLPLLLLGGLPALPALPALEFYEWGVLALAVIGLAAVVFARTRLAAIVLLGVQGMAVALIYLLFGAPDLSFTQFIVEILSVVIFALVMTRLQLNRPDQRPASAVLRDGIVAIAAGVGAVLVLVAVVARPLDSRLNTFFETNSVALAHGRNIVNVILVDFRGLDTLGEISVVMTAGLAILALIATGRQLKPAGPRRSEAKRRKRASTGKRSRVGDAA